MEVTIHLPDALRSERRLGKHRILQLAASSRTVTAEAELVKVTSRSFGLRVDADDGEIWIVRSGGHAPADAERVLLSDESLDEACAFEDLRLKWVRAPGLGGERPVDGRPADQLAWQEAFRFRPTDPDKGGLRPPQVGALHAVLAHWTVSDDIATVVLPTGTGKTETMMAAVAVEGLGPVGIAVPTKALRDQTAAKFSRWGVLRTVGALAEDVPLPVVALVRGGISDAEVDILLSADVLVATMASLNASSVEVRARLATGLSHLFVDEAHHVPARTWDAFRSGFRSGQIVQFTATPFRTDRKRLPGKIVFEYPLRAAQEAEYFKPIQFVPVREFDPGRSDEVIATAAVARLREDLEAGHDHLMMARTANIARADAVAEIYRTLVDDEVVCVHSGRTPSEREDALRKLADREARIVVCVDMLGEGYDLPALKIAALHDAHRSLGITLQFIGRFTRTAQGIGDATVVANLADVAVASALEDMYAENSDWNALVSQLHAGAIGREVRRIEFFQGFDGPLGEISVQNVRPKMSTTIFRVGATWRPDDIPGAVPAGRLVAFEVNRQENLAALVTATRESIPWGDIDAVTNLVYDLVVLFYDQGQGLLFVHSSDTSRYQYELAEAACGEGIEHIRGEEVFRALHGINRLLVANLGLRHAIGRSVRFTMYAGVNVHEGLTEQNFANKMTSNLFGFGFEDGERASVGCSYKGRLWSYKVSDDLEDWARWCSHVGRKVNDPTIDPADFLRTSIHVEAVTGRPPDLVPIGIEWNPNVWIRSESLISFTFGEVTWPLLEVGIEMIEPSAAAPLQFRLFVDSGDEAVYELVIDEEGPRYDHASGPTVTVRSGSQTLTLHEWLLREPPSIRFSNGAQLVGDLLMSEPTAVHPFDAGRVEVWDFDGVEITRESQGTDKDPTSIQYHVIRRVIDDCDVLIDDDGPNEAADVVTISIDGETARFSFYLCKFGTADGPRNQVTDLYELCGQAQRTVHWKGDRERLIDHLRRRAANSERRGRQRIEKGSQEILERIGRQLRSLNVEFEIVLVHPGVSQAGLSQGQRDLLATTELYLNETFAVPMRVITSA